MVWRHELSVVQSELQYYLLTIPSDFQFAFSWTEPRSHKHLLFPYEVLVWWFQFLYGSKLSLDHLMIQKSHIHTTIKETYSEITQTSKTELFAQTVNGLKLRLRYVTEFLMCIWIIWKKITHTDLQFHKYKCFKKLYLVCKNVPWRRSNWLKLFENILNTLHYIVFTQLCNSSTHLMPLISF